MKTFISHISEEKRLACVLKKWIENAFLGYCEVFVSSHESDLHPGDKWLETIDAALNDARVFLVLCSPASLPRPWINFETGCAWTKRAKIIPVCHSGQEMGRLPPPLSHFQAIQIERQECYHSLMSVLAGELRAKKLPTIDYNDMFKECNDAIRTQQANETNRALLKTIPESVNRQQVSIIQVIHENGDRGFTSHQIANELQFQHSTIQFLLDHMVSERWLNTRRTLAKGRVYELTEHTHQCLIECAEDPSLSLSDVMQRRRPCDGLTRKEQP